MIIDILKGTPIYVWIILIILLKRAKKASQEHEVNIGKSMIVPTIFALWGLESIIHFPNIISSLVVYIITALCGLGVGYFIYSKNRKVFMKNNHVYIGKSIVPIIIILGNFIIKYGLNIYMDINQNAIHTFSFDIVYSIACGLSVGLFFGGIIQVYKFSKL